MVRLRVSIPGAGFFRNLNVPNTAATSRPKAMIARTVSLPLLEGAPATVAELDDCCEEAADAVADEISSPGIVLAEISEDASATNRPDSVSRFSRFKSARS